MWQTDKSGMTSQLALIGGVPIKVRGSSTRADEGHLRTLGGGYIRIVITRVVPVRP